VKTRFRQLSQSLCEGGEVLCGVRKGGEREGKNFTAKKRVSSPFREKGRP